LKKPSSTFCILPWVHVSTKTNGEMRLCCTTCASSAGKDNDKQFGGKLGVNRDDDGRPANLNRTRLLEGWNNNYMKKVRLQMLAGEQPASCQKCFTEESNGVQSKRNWETQYWSERVNVEKLLRETQEDGSVPPIIRYLDLRLGHHCNLKCTMCSPHDSSKWIKDWKNIYPQVKNPRLKELMIWKDDGTEDGASYDWHKNPQFWEDLYGQIPHLKQIYFAGGEPMLIKEHFELVEECIRRGEAHHIELRYNSNGTFLPKELLKMWKHFKRIRFGLSIDDFGERNHYVRFPANWNRIEKNLRLLDETGDHIEVTLACAVQALNIFYLPDFLKWKLNQKFKKINSWPRGAGLINIHLVYHPAFLNVRVLPKEFKQQTEEKYQEFFGWLKNHDDRDYENHPYGVKRLKNFLKFMNSGDWSKRMPEFREYIKLLDQRRKTDFRKVFPEMAGLLDSKNKEPERQSISI